MMMQEIHECGESAACMIVFNIHGMRTTRHVPKVERASTYVS